MFNPKNSANQVEPLCPIYGECGGCQYQHLSYRQELVVKEEQLQRLFKQNFSSAARLIKPIVASPKEYHYRHRLDVRLLKTRNNEIFMGFTPTGRAQVIEADSCAIALPEISQYLPRLKSEAVQKLPEKYRNANLVIRTGDEGRVFWGGIGRRSLRMLEENYFWTKVNGKKIFYSLETFFQANLSILPKVVTEIKKLKFFNKKISFYDLYGGVGLFGIAFYANVKEVVLIESDPHSVKLAQFNKQHHHFENFHIFQGLVERVLELKLQENANVHKVAMIDPPRQGLSASVVKTLTTVQGFKALLYLSCSPESLVRDLKLLSKVWQIKRVIPFDFFPKTKHLETLVVLKPKSKTKKGQK